MSRELCRVAGMEAAPGLVGAVLAVEEMVVEDLD
jgi:hypothetical protein